MEEFYIDFRNAYERELKFEQDLLIACGFDSEFARHKAKKELDEELQKLPAKISNVLILAVKDIK